MKKFINFYLDESGNALSEFFIVGGFYLISNDYTEIQTIENKIKANILKTEKAIKFYRQNHEKKFNQYIDINENKNHKEVKWNTLSTANKIFLFNNIKNFNQQNLSISCNLKKWKSKNNKPLNLDAIYNMMVYYLVERTVGKLQFGATEEISIKINIDQRKSAPKLTENNKKLEPLEGYINTCLYINPNFNEIKVNVKQLESSMSPLIRYSDYYVGLISSMCRVVSGSPKKWDKDINVLFDIFHKKMFCFCHYTIKDQCEVISAVCNQCKGSKI